MRPQEPQKEGGGEGGGRHIDQTSSSSNSQKHLDNSSAFGVLALTQAISLGDSDAVMKILDSGIPLSILGPGTALHLLARSAPSLEPPALLLLALLLQHGAGANGGIDVLDEEGFSPLHRFVALSLPPAVSLLLDHKADMNLLSLPPSSSSPLHLAAQRKDEGMCLLLLGRGGEEGGRDGEGRTPGDYFPELGVLREGNGRREEGGGGGGGGGNGGGRREMEEG